MSRSQGLDLLRRNVEPLGEKFEYSTHWLYDLRLSLDVLLMDDPLNYDFDEYNEPEYDSYDEYLTIITDVACDFSDECTPPRPAFDPMDFDRALIEVPQLPTEIVCRIFEYCSVTSIRDLITWNLVCRDWRVISTYIVHKQIITIHDHPLCALYVMKLSLDTELEDWRSAILRNGVFAEITSLKHDLYASWSLIKQIEFEAEERIREKNELSDDSDLINFDDTSELSD